MRSVSCLLSNENLSKLIRVQRYLDKAGVLFDEVFAEEGAPSDTELVLEGFFEGLSISGKGIERLMGAAVYHDLFPLAETSSTHQ